MRQTKTSETHPLPFAEVIPSQDCGRILFTMCPGKVQPHAETGPWERNLDTDFKAISSAGTTAVLTLMDQDELQRCAISPDLLRTACKNHDIQWLHCPIEDFQAPDEVWENAWSTIGHTLRQKLRNAETIVVHCRGGRGRAGMVAARLLVEFGMAADEAMALVRTQRPEAIETTVQESHIRACMPVTAT